MQQKPKKNFTTKMMISLLSAIIIGGACIALREYLGVESPIWRSINHFLFQDITKDGAQQAIGLFYIIGKLFINTLQLVLVPLVFTSIILAICHLQDTKTLERISLKTLWTFFSLTIMALVLATVVGYTSYLLGAFTIDLHIPITSQQGVVANNPLLVLLNLIPNNLFTAFSDNNAILALVFISLSVGLCVNFLGDKVKTFKKLIVEINQIAMTFLSLTITKIGPYAIFALLVRTIASYGIEYLQPAAVYIGISVPTLLFFLIIMLPGYAKVITKLNPLTFLRKTMQIALFGFSTSSSAATLPLNSKICNENLGIHEDITAFVVPLGTAMNKTGTAIIQVISSLFVAGVAGYTVTPLTLGMIVTLTFIASISTPSIPGAGAIVLFTILSGVGFTNETALVIYSLILAINPPIEMLATALNVVDDTVSALCIAKSEGLLDENIYNNINQSAEQINVSKNN